MEYTYHLEHKYSLETKSGMIGIKFFPFSLCSKWYSIIFWREKFILALIKMFVKKVVRGNAVQICPNFPAKSLSI